jgi:dipeptidyl aminopeptidase/acylaminoacyl peptidase
MGAAGRPRSAKLSTLLALAALLLGSSCTSEGSRDGSAGDPARADETTTGTTEATTTAPGSTPPTEPSEPPVTSAPPAEPPHPVSLQALIQKRYDGRGLRLGQVLARTDAYTRHFATYKSGPLTISGIMNVPAGAGPFPVLVLLHGYIDPDIYTNGRGLAREQDYLAREGYVVLHIDYRNHAQSDDDLQSDLRLRLGYTEDVINAVLAVKRSKLPFLDRERVGLLGRSMGGGVTYNVLVVRPGLVDAAVVYAPVSSDTVNNFNRWIRPDPGRSELARRVIAAYGAPERNPEFWRNVSPVNFLDRVTEPILIHHGTADVSCPIRWSHATLAALQAASKRARMFTYPGEPHAFEAGWPLSMRRTVAFLDRQLAG